MLDKNNFFKICERWPFWGLLTSEFYSPLTTVFGVVRCSFGADKRNSLFWEMSHHSTWHACSIWSISAPFETETKPPLPHSTVFLSQLADLSVVWFSCFVLLWLFCPSRRSRTSLAYMMVKVLATAPAAGAGSPLESAGVTTYSQFSQNNLVYKKKNIMA